MGGRPRGLDLSLSVTCVGGVWPAASPSPDFARDATLFPPLTWGFVAGAAPRPHPMGVLALARRVVVVPGAAFGAALLVTFVESSPGCW